MCALPAILPVSPALELQVLTVSLAQLDGSTWLQALLVRLLVPQPDSGPIQPITFVKHVIHRATPALALPQAIA